MRKLQITFEKAYSWCAKLCEKYALPSPILKTVHHEFMINIGTIYLGERSEYYINIIFGSAKRIPNRVEIDDLFFQFQPILSFRVMLSDMLYVFFLSGWIPFILTRKQELYLMLWGLGRGFIKKNIYTFLM